MSAPAQRTKHLIQLFVSLLLLAAALLIFTNRQLLYDYAVASQYRPSPPIAAIAERTGLTEKGTFLFYASQPQLLDRAAFNSVCRSEATEHTAVLGCYTRHQIYLFDISNQELDGIKEVTAAHEMLHAAYQRLSETDRDKVDAMLDRQSYGADDARIKELLAQYEETEPGQRLNELHSILGTEVAQLSPELEEYYSRYFKDRAAVVNLSDRYQAVFASLEAKQETLVTELNVLADQIERLTSVYKRELQVLESDIRSFNARASSGTMSRAEYDRERASLEQRQTALRDDYDTIQGLSESYDRKREELAAINSESEVLNRSINSSIRSPQEGIDG